MREFLAITSALADTSRVRLLLALEEQEVCVCNLVEVVGLADSTVSKHMSILKQAGLVESRKCGRWVYYRLVDADASAVAKAAIRLVREHLKNDKTVVLDAIKLQALRQGEDTKCATAAVSCIAEPAGALQDA